MDFDTYLANSWSEHVGNPAGVALSLRTASAFIIEGSQLIQIANLITHVFGEHLGEFENGIAVLEKLAASEYANDEIRRSLSCSILILNFASGEEPEHHEFSVPERVKIYATTAGIQVARNELEPAAVNFRQSLALAENLSVNDSANRIMAVTSNSFACLLEEKSTLTQSEKDLMILAAQSSRKFWQNAGTWLEAERAEYRLSQSYLRAGDIISSIKHANLCLTICEQHQAEPLEFFFAFEAISLVENAMKQPLRSLPKMQKCFNELSQNDKLWCEKTLKKIESLQLRGFPL